jgi:hypothetical protein
MTARIQDYPTLAQALQDFQHRIDIANFQDYFIQFGELKIYRDIFSQNMGNGVQWMETIISGAVDPNTGFYPVPSGYLSLKDMQVSDGSGNTWTLIYKDPQWVYARYPVRQASGVPAYVARDGQNFVFGPFPDDGYAITGTYYMQSAPLTSFNPTTWMTTICPELLFASCMVELQPFLKDQAGSDMWGTMYTSKLEGLLSLDKADRLSAGTMAVNAQ